VLFAVLGIFALWLGRAAATMPPVIPVAVAVSLIAGFITIIRPDLALTILVFSMLLSPEITLAEIPRRSIVVRVDDLLIVTIFFVWLVKSAMQKGIALFVKTPLNAPILVYTLVAVIGTGKAVLTGDAQPLAAVFYVLKYIEYYFLYILVSNLTVSRKQVRHYLWAGAVTAVLVCLFAYSHMGSANRLYAPFDDAAGGQTGESATLGGYLLLIMSMSLGFFTQIPAFTATVSSLAFFCFMLPPFVLTLSRASYAGLAFSLLTTLVFSRRKQILLIGLLVGAGLLVPRVAPRLFESAVSRLAATFIAPDSYVSVGGRQIGLESSAADRVRSWRYAFNVWLRQRPLLGHGVSGVGTVDAQYPLILGELGILGFSAFLWLTWRLVATTWRVYRNAQVPFDRAVSLGFLSVMGGLYVQALTTNTFIIVRIMEPFWFLAAMVMKLPVLPPEAEPAALPKNAAPALPQTPLWRKAG